MIKRMQYVQHRNLFLIGIVLLSCIFLNYILFGVSYIQRFDVFIAGTLCTLVVWIPVCFLLTLPAQYLRRRFPVVRQTWQRLILLLLTNFLLTSLAICILSYGYGWIDFPYYIFQATRLQTALLFGFVGNAIITVISESVYTFEHWSRTITETEQLRQANLQSQLEGLKNQVNPHFLFNSLNSLSSLIDEAPERAEQFIEELASVYRYLLQTNEGELTTLASELRFIHSYYHLQRTRYGNALTLKTSITPAYESAKIPPLTLQLLVENAIKHNVIAVEQPLEIIIETDRDNLNGKPILRVRNNLQRRPLRVLSNGVGLANIAKKYQLLGQGDLQIEEKANQFIVTLPLLTN